MSIKSKLRKLVKNYDAFEMKQKGFMVAVTLPNMHVGEEMLGSIEDILAEREAVFVKTFCIYDRVHRGSCCLYVLRTGESFVVFLSCSVMTVGEVVEAVMSEDAVNISPRVVH